MPTRAISSVVALALGVWVLCTCGSAAAATEGAIAEFSTPAAESEPAAIVSGPDGNLWFTEFKAEKIGRITPDGAITEFSIPTPVNRPDSITLGPEGSLWFAERKGNNIGRISVAGAISEFPVPTAESEPEGIALGPDGNLWFTEYKGDKIGQITPSGAITEFPVPTAESGPQGIAPGPDGNVWFTELKADKIGRIAAGGAITEFPVPTAESGPLGIAPGPDGNVWFTEIGANKIGRITPGGVIAEFALASSGSQPSHIAPGPDGNLWFTEYKGDRIGRITPTGTIGEFQLPSAESHPIGITPGSDGNMWFAEAKTDKLGQIGTGAPAASASPPTVIGGAQAGTEQTCETTWATWASLQPAASLFGFDGYSWQLAGAQVATGQVYTPTIEAIGKALTCTETVTYPLLDVTASAASAAVTVVAPPPPAITAVRQSAARWREGGRLARTSRAKQRHVPPLGSTFSFALSEEARVSFSFTERLAGRRVGHRCLAKSRGNAKRGSCKRTVTAGTLSFDGHSGTNKVVFQGRVSRSKKLAPGRYTLVVLATNAEGARSKPASLSFTIVG